jgi:hypothetical protein
MRELYGEGLASHTDPESCASGREAGREAFFPMNKQGRHPDFPPFRGSIARLHVPLTGSAALGVSVHKRRTGARLGRTGPARSAVFA